MGMYQISRGGSRVGPLSVRRQSATHPAVSKATGYNKTNTYFSSSESGRRCNNQRKRSVVLCGLNNSQTTGTSTSATAVARDNLRLALPSKGRMAEDTLALLKDCQLNVVKPNPRQYVAQISQMPGVEVWFQRATDVVRKLTYGDVDIGFVGHDMVAEIGDGHEELLIVHDALGYGSCHLALGVPATGKFADVNTIEDLKNMAWSASNPLRVVTGYHNIARKFFAEVGMEHVELLSADGALEAAPAMGCADIILDLVSTGVTLRENNLKEIEGGKIMESEGVLVVNKTSLLERPGMMELVHELLERLEAHLVAQKYYSVIVNMTGTSADDVSERLIQAGLGGLQGPTVSSVYPEGAPGGYFAAIVCVPKKELYPAVKSLRKLGGSGVLVQPMTYIFDDEPPRWLALTNNLGISTKSIDFA
ncbi:ATP phosphoribosyltransferase 2 [Picochlorum sp. SENEW3]|nr:ATP phosphoribosyltransferase 2 [Picochlorum sp. SENEW3]